MPIRPYLRWQHPWTVFPLGTKGATLSTVKSGKPTTTSRAPGGVKTQKDYGNGARSNSCSWMVRGAPLPMQIMVATAAMGQSNKRKVSDERRKQYNTKNHNNNTFCRFVDFLQYDLLTRLLFYVFTHASSRKKNFIRVFCRVISVPPCRTNNQALSSSLSTRSMGTNTVCGLIEVVKRGSPEGLNPASRSTTSSSVP